MYAQRYQPPGGIRPGGLGFSLGITGAMVAGLIFANPHLTRAPAAKVLAIDNIRIAPPPPPNPPKPQPKPVLQQRLIAPVPLVHPSPSPDPVLTLSPPVDFGPVAPPSGLGAGIASGPALDAPAPPPVMIDAQIDPRYAGALQPAYPPEERRAEHEGRVVVRVLIGTDGRVKQVERRSADSDAFYRATETQALRAWRFRPATRNGVPVEGWRMMSIRFVLEEG